MEKHELGKIDFELIDDAFKALLQSHPDPMKAGNERQSVAERRRLQKVRRSQNNF